MKSELSFGLLAMMWLWAGCTTAQVQATRQIPTRIETHEAIAIVVSPETTDLTSDAVGCISKALKERFPNLRIVLPDEFHKVAFPDIALELAPRALIYLPLLLDDPAFRARIAPLGLRYLISVQGKTDQQTKPFVGGAGGGGGAVTVFGAVFDRKSNVTASILDLQQGQSGEVRASAEGKPWFACIGLLIMCAPIGAPAFTEAKACDEIGTAVAKFFAGESPLKLSKNLRLSDLAEISRGLISRAELQEHFGNPLASDNTSVGRKTETYLIDNTELAFVYGEDDRVLYSYNTKADPPERYKQAISPMAHPLNNIEVAKCPKLKVCVERYIEEARKRAKEVSYSLTNEGHKETDSDKLSSYEDRFRKSCGVDALFRKDLEIASDVDKGKVSKEEAIRFYNSASEQRERRKVSPDLYNAMLKLTDRLLDGLKDSRDSMTGAVVGYIDEFRKLMTGFDHRLSCADEVTFKLEVDVAKDADEGKLTMEEGLNQLRTITTRHRIMLYYGRS